MSQGDRREVRETLTAQEVVQPRQLSLAADIPLRSLLPLLLAVGTGTILVFIGVDPIDTTRTSTRAASSSRFSGRTP